MRCFSGRPVASERGENALDLGDQFDLDEYIPGQPGDFDRGPGRRRSVLADVGTVYLVHGCKVVEIFEEDGGLDYAVKTAARGIEDGFQIFEHTGRLFDDAAGDDLLGERIEGNLPGGEDKVPGADGLGIGPDGRRSCVGCYHRFVHALIVMGGRQGVIRLASRNSGQLANILAGFSCNPPATMLPIYRSEVWRTHQPHQGSPGDEGSSLEVRVEEDAT